MGKPKRTTRWKINFLEHSCSGSQGWVQWSRGCHAVSVQSVLILVGSEPSTEASGDEWFVWAPGTSSDEARCAIRKGFAFCSFSLSPAFSHEAFLHLLILGLSLQVPALLGFVPKGEFSETLSFVFWLLVLLGEEYYVMAFSPSFQDVPTLRFKFERMGEDGKLAYHTHMPTLGESMHAMFSRTVCGSNHVSIDMHSSAAKFV